MIRRSVVERVAALARLDLSDDEIETMRGELSRILEFVEELNELDLPRVPPRPHREEAGLQTREDRPVPFPADDLIDQAPSLSRRLYEVPIIIGEGESSDA